MLGRTSRHFDRAAMITQIATIRTEFRSTDRGFPAVTLPFFPPPPRSSVCGGREPFTT